MDNQESAPSGKDRFVTRKAVGERITFLREARGLSQKALSVELAKLGLVVRPGDYHTMGKRYTRSENRVSSKAV